MVLARFSMVGWLNVRALLTDTYTLWTNNAQSHICTSAEFEYTRSSTFLITRLYGVGVGRCLSSQVRLSQLLKMLVNYLAAQTNRMNNETNLLWVYYCESEMCHAKCTSRQRWALEWSSPFYFRLVFVCISASKTRRWGECFYFISRRQPHAHTWALCSWELINPSYCLCYHSRREHGVWIESHSNLETTNYGNYMEKNRSQASKRYAQTSSNECDGTMFGWLVIYSMPTNGQFENNTNKWHECQAPTKGTSE